MGGKFPPETEIAGRRPQSPVTASISVVAAIAAARWAVAAFSPG